MKSHMDNPKKFRELMGGLFEYLPGFIALAIIIAVLYSIFSSDNTEPKNEHQSIENKIKRTEYRLWSYETELIEFQFKVDSLKVLAPIIEKFRAPYMAKLHLLNDKYFILYDDGTIEDP